MNSFNRIAGLVLGLMTFLLLSPELHAQKPSKYQVDTIQVSSQCSMCKDRIEEGLAFERGIKSSTVDYAKGELIVRYKTKRTNLDEIRKAVSEMGYDADEVPANKEAYVKLPECCKKPEDRAPGHDHDHDHDHQH